MVQAAQAQHKTEVASHKSAYTTLYKGIVDIQEQLQGLPADRADSGTASAHAIVCYGSHPLSCILTMLPCCSVPFVLDKRLAVSQACITPAM